MFTFLKTLLGGLAALGHILAIWRRGQDIKTGQLQQQKADLEEHAAAMKRVQEAEAAPRGREVTQDALDKGRF